MFLNTLHNLVLESVYSSISAENAPDWSKYTLTLKPPHRFSTVAVVRGLRHETFIYVPRIVKNGRSTTFRASSLGTSAVLWSVADKRLKPFVACLKESRDTMYLLITEMWSGFHLAEVLCEPIIIHQVSLNVLLIDAVLKWWVESWSLTLYITFFL